VQLVNHANSLFHDSRTDAMKRHHHLLLLILDWNLGHIWLHCSACDRLRVIAIVLLPAIKSFDVLWCD
jgi:hypothetical protein